MTNDKQQEENRIFESLLEYLKETRGFDFTGYKRSTLKRRVTRRMQSHNIDNFGDYLDYLEVHPEEFEPLFNTILINVTAFFRDTDAWDYLQHQLLPKLLQQKDKREQIRVWSAGCSSGEEAYSIAMLLAEIMGLEQFRQRVKIYATDVDEEALDQARWARYTSKALENVSEEWRQCYFEQVNNQYVFRSDIRRVVIFGRNDLVQDAPISRLDLLICRNTLMYFNAETQKRILARFNFALKENGTLFLGKAEMLLTNSNLFIPVNLKHRLFTKVATPKLSDRLLIFAQAGDKESSARLSERVRLREAAFNTSPIAQIIVDVNGYLVLANMIARSMFDIKRQDLGRLFQDLELSYRPLELRSLIDDVYRDRTSITINDVVREESNTTQYLDVQISPLKENGNGEQLLGVSISFQDVTRYNQLHKKYKTSSQELETANEELQSSNEELETTNEELQSTNEELETTNEELQSTNEELETMNEELESTNEELRTMNDELRLRTDEVNQVNAFLNSILESFQTGVIIVDREFKIIRWNEYSEELWGLRSDEVEDKSLLSLDIGLPVKQLREPIRNCYQGEVNHQTIMVDAINRRGQSIQCQVTFHGLKGIEEQLHGTIILVDEVNQEDG
ncbi:CheR methyltransferase, SAM binding domain protein [Coleofasciculus chthonoplastes PCC 7420]|uniref:protein-glutamate O-methyltransferase n=1 Tax=Coleofasciculus chthonoplastes PCC 7420 TaxID=118168 RepID=B4VPP9_9CYAN|nr:CheR family methyltransferase [Coleofasciculus chthonoplastes]EDX76143.1 CheR methyltransferase, SAM binding domain protein [Coleofasciculus chthonoplastes PCC 7420]